MFTFSLIVTEHRYRQGREQLLPRQQRGLRGERERQQTVSPRPSKPNRTYNSPRLYNVIHAVHFKLRSVIKS